MMAGNDTNLSETNICPRAGQRLALRLGLGSMGAMDSMLLAVIARPVLGGLFGSRIRSKPHLTSCQ